MDQPKIPTLKDSQKPQVKVRGLEASATLFDRLKQFKKKDLIFILAGLATLFMAPLAEHFMMAPDSDVAGNQGFGGKGGSGASGFGGGSSPYEPGTSGLAPGSAVGGGSDVITPLNVRDPSALVMGPGATQQPPTNSVMPPTPAPTPSSRSDSELKDALAASARGVGAAAKKSLQPVPKISLAGSQLRSLGVVSGGSSAAASLSAPSSGGLVSGKANAGSGGLNSVHALPGYKGVGARGQSSGGSGIDALKKAADNAGDRMNQGGATNALTDAAATAIPGGGTPAGGNGAGGGSAADKAAGPDASKDSKSTGESLAFLAAKARQEASLALEAKLKEIDDKGLFWHGLRNKMIESALTTAAGDFVKAVDAPIAAKIGKIMGPHDAKVDHYYDCTDIRTNAKGPDFISGTQVSDDPCDPKKPQFPYALAGAYIQDCASTGPTYVCKAALDPSGDTAAAKSAGASSAMPGAPGGAPRPDLFRGIGGSGSKNTLADACAALTRLEKAEKLKASIDAVLKEAKTIAAARDALDADKPTADCGADPSQLPDGSVRKLQEEALRAPTGTRLVGQDGALVHLIGLVNSSDKKALADSPDVQTVLAAAKSSGKAEDLLKDTKKSIDGIVEAPDPDPNEVHNAIWSIRQYARNEDKKTQMENDIKNGLKTIHGAKADLGGRYDSLNETQTQLSKELATVGMFGSSSKEGRAIRTVGSKGDGTLAGVVQVNADYEALKTKIKTGPPAVDDVHIKAMDVPEIKADSGGFAGDIKPDDVKDKTGEAEKAIGKVKPEKAAAALSAGTIDKTAPKDDVVVAGDAVFGVRQSQAAVLTDVKVTLEALPKP